MRLLSLLLPFFGMLHAQCLSFGLIPSENITTILREYSRFTEAIERRSGVCIDIRISSDYEGVIEGIGDGSIDIARLGPFSYVLAKERSGAEAFAVGVREGGYSSYRSLLVTNERIYRELGIKKRLRGEAGMRELKVLLAKRAQRPLLAFTDRASTSGYLIPGYYMERAGLGMEEFGKITFLGSHDSSIMAVESSMIGFGFANDKSYSKLQKSGAITAQKTPILWESDPIPESPLVFRKDLHEAIKKKVKEAVVSMEPQYLPNYGSLVRYKETTPEAYAIIEDIKHFMDSQD